MNGADWLLAALADEGVPVLFGNPGSTELPITDALGRQERVRYVLGLHESVVLGMADGWAQATGGLAAVNVHVQPGLANAMSGILNAARARVPLLVTVGQQVRALLPSEPFLGGDLTALGRTLAKGAWEVGADGDLDELTARAIRVATTPPRGPVVLSLPLDVQVAPAPPPHVPAPRPEAPPPPPEALAAAAAALRAARAPLLLAGDGVVHAGASDALAALAARLGAPVRGEPMAASVPLPTDHPLWAGPLPPFASQIAPLLAPHDVVLAVGMPVFRLFGTSPGEAVPPGVRLLHMDVDPHEIGKVHRPAVGMPGDPRQGLEALLTLIGPGDPSAPPPPARRPGAPPPPDRGPVSPAALSRAVARAAGPDDLVVDEALTSTRALREAIGPRTAATWMAHRGSALGWGLPAAVGARIADPSRRVLALQGDGSLLFGVSALWTAARQGTGGPALVVADNGGYEILRAGLEGLTGRAEGAWPGLALGAPLDLAAICRGFGATAERADRAEALDDALADLWRRAEDGPAVLVVAVEGRTPAVGYPVEAS